MTIRQEATNLIYNLPDENVRLVIEMMQKMLTPVQTNTTEVQSGKTIASNRIGMGKNIINDPEHFDDWNSEITNLFES